LLRTDKNKARLGEQWRFTFHCTHRSKFSL